MATPLSSAFRRMSLEMVQRFGSSYTLRRRFPGVRDKRHPTRPMDVVIKDYPCQAAITSYQVNQIDFINVLRGDVQAVVAYTPDIPEDIVPGDQFVDREVVYNIIPPEERVTVNGELVAYILQLRR